MNLEILRAFFGWCTLLNGGLFIVSSLPLMYAGDFIYKLHRRWFPMPRETFTASLYVVLGLWKISVIIFNLIPWIVLAVLT